MVDSKPSEDAVEKVDDLIARLRSFEGSDELGNGDFSVCIEAANRLSLNSDAELAELRAERDALLQKPIDLAKMDSIDEDASDKMVAYYWWQQAQEARAEIKRLSLIPNEAKDG